MRRKLRLVRSPALHGGHPKLARGFGLAEHLLAKTKMHCLPVKNGSLTVMETRVYCGSKTQHLSPYVNERRYGSAPATTVGFVINSSMETV